MSRMLPRNQQGILNHDNQQQAYPSTTDVVNHNQCCLSTNHNRSQPIITNNVVTNRNQCYQLVSWGGKKLTVHLFIYVCFICIKQILVCLRCIFMACDGWKELRVGLQRRVTQLIRMNEHCNCVISLPDLLWGGQCCKGGGRECGTSPQIQSYWNPLLQGLKTESSAHLLGGLALLWTSACVRVEWWWCEGVNGGG